MSSQELKEIAAALEKARISQTPIDPPKKTYPALTADGAFEVQRITVQNAVKSGDRHVGYKLGNIAKVMQAASGLNHPDYGFLLGSFFLHEGQKISLSKFIKPYVELEPAFVLKGHLKGPNVTIADVVRAIDFAIPAIEIIDSRVKDWAIGLEDTLADNGSQGGIILGGTPRQITDLNLHNTKGVLKFNGTEIMAGNTQNILGNPLAATAWLVNRLAEYDVEFLPGQVIMPGSCLQAMPMDQPGRWSCSFEGWGTIEFDVVE
ncbi:putative TodF product hydratase [Dactylonectria macrodidyma]|uniref:TodF product hydratase n=1 Tax=Dactylonectria macrodidyma TaxID=307937 RepID=A0A9P9JM59_9HYPO|nr:putative TodF product hydratase [Dactylonectria macrodidyma]